MKTFTARIIRRVGAACFLTLLAGCNYSDSAHRDDRKETPGEQVGHAAYLAKKDAKKAAEEISQDLKSFKHDAHEGYQEEKQKDLEHPKTPPPQ